MCVNLGKVVDLLVDDACSLNVKKSTMHLLNSGICHFTPYRLEKFFQYEYFQYE